MMTTEEKLKRAEALADAADKVVHGTSTIGQQSEAVYAVLRPALAAYRDVAVDKLPSPKWPPKDRPPGGYDSWAAYAGDLLSRLEQIRAWAEQHHHGGHISTVFWAQLGAIIDGKSTGLPQSTGLPAKADKADLLTRVAELEDELEEERRLHAACLSIAEGAPGWDRPIPNERPAQRAVRHLRLAVAGDAVVVTKKEYDQLQEAKLFYLAHLDRQVISRAKHLRPEFDRQEGAWRDDAYLRTNGLPDEKKIARFLLDALTGGSLSSLICEVRDELLPHAESTTGRRMSNLREHLRALGEDIP